MELEIHEFSDGIKPYGTSDNWESRGFTGGYMNSTFREIPYNVERAIANDEFKVGVLTTPAILGRVVGGDGSSNSDWSVVAIATPSRDEQRKNFPLYRYFLAEGDESLSLIVAWLLAREHGDLPLFNPFEKKQIGKPLTERVLQPTPSKLVKKDESPRLIPANQEGIDFLSVLNQLAHQKAKVNGQPVSWAYNVETLEKPERFQIILPASDRAFKIIQQALAAKPKQIASSAIDEKALKQAVKGLADNPSVKPEHCQTFVENIAIVANTFGDRADDYWHNIFDGQGASNGFKQEIYTQSMIKLLTLRAIAIPETLPAFLNWLQLDQGKQNYGEISRQFQAQLSPYIKQESGLKPTLLKSSIDLVAKVFREIVTPESAAWLLLSEQGVWGQYERELMAYLKRDLEAFGRYNGNISKTINLTFSGGEWNQIWNEIQPHWRSSPLFFNKKYYPLAELFRQLKDDKLFACFYQLSYGFVPKEKFPIAHWTADLYGLKILKEGYNPQGEKIMTYPFVGAIAIATLIFGLVGGVFMQKLLLSKLFPEELPKPPSANSTLPTKTTPSPTVSADITPKILEGGLKKFEVTRNSIYFIIQEIDLKEKVSESLIQDNLKKVLGEPKLDFKEIDADKISEDTKKEWVKAIYKYQQKSGLGADGIIDKNGKSYKKLAEDVSKLVKPLNPSPANPSSPPPENPS